ncbi:MAG: hypothetical protein ACE5Q6_09265 [Dehalococcoidia bacterium]
MPIIINEVEVIAPPPDREAVRDESPENIKAPGPTPHDIFWTMRRLIERQVRLQAR